MLQLGGLDHVQHPNAAAGMRGASGGIAHRNAMLRGLVYDDEKDTQWRAVGHAGPRCDSRSAKRQARQPSCRQCDGNGNRAISSRSTNREVGNLGVETNLRHDERCRLPADHVAVAYEEYLNKVGSGRYVLRKAECRAEKPLAEK